MTYLNYDDLTEEEKIGFDDVCVDKFLKPLKKVTSRSNKYTDFEGWLRGLVTLGTSIMIDGIMLKIDVERANFSSFKLNEHVSDLIRKYDADGVDSSFRERCSKLAKEMSIEMKFPWQEAISSQFDIIEHMRRR